jgi:hypothetical protein
MEKIRACAERTSQEQCIVDNRAGLGDGVGRLEFTAQTPDQIAKERPPSRR